MYEWRVFCTARRSDKLERTLAIVIVLLLVTIGPGSDSLSVGGTIWEWAIPLDLA
jgi:hypothetical protein